MFNKINSNLSRFIGIFDPKFFYEAQKGITRLINHVIACVILGHLLRKHKSYGKHHAAIFFLYFLVTLFLPILGGALNLSTIFIRFIR